MESLRWDHATQVLPPQLMNGLCSEALSSPFTHTQLGHPQHNNLVTPPTGTAGIPHPPLHFLQLRYPLSHHQHIMQWPSQHTEHMHTAHSTQHTCTQHTCTHAHSTHAHSTHAHSTHAHTHTAHRTHAHMHTAHTHTAHTHMHTAHMHTHRRGLGGLPTHMPLQSDKLW